MKLYPSRALLLAGVAVALSTALSGCGTGEPTPTPSTGSPEGATVETRTAKVGDCRLESATGLPADAEVVPCDEPHDEEIFHTITLTGDAYAQADVDAATAECVGDAFTTFVGVSNSESTLEVYPLAPTSASWDEADGRTVACVLFDPAGQVEGSLEGAGR